VGAGKIDGRFCAFVVPVTHELANFYSRGSYNNVICAGDCPVLVVHPVLGQHGKVSHIYAVDIIDVGAIWLRAAH